MKKTIDLYDFRKEFEDYNRQDNFSYEGLEALFYDIERMEWETGEELELDVIALCCDFTEYDIEDFISEYFTAEEAQEFLIDPEGEIEAENIDKEAVQNYIEERSFFIPVTETSFIIRNF